MCTQYYMHIDSVSTKIMVGELVSNVTLYIEVLYNQTGQNPPSFSLLQFIRVTYSSKSVNTSLIQLLLSTVWWICTVFQEPSDRKLYFNLADGEGSSANNVRIRFVTGKSLHLQAHYYYNIGALIHFGTTHLGSLLGVADFFCDITYDWRSIICIKNSIWMNYLG